MECRIECPLDIVQHENPESMTECRKNAIFFLLRISYRRWRNKSLLLGGKKNMAGAAATTRENITNRTTHAPGDLNCVLHI